MALVSTTSTSTSSNSPAKTDLRAMSIATALFFMWGLLTSLNDVLIPHLKSTFELSNTQAALVQTAFFFSYFAFALVAGKMVEWRGYKQSMILGLMVAAAGALLFLPAAGAASFNIFLTALVVLAAGITCLQVAANPYVTSLGPQATAASRLNLSQAFNSLGTILGPVVGGILILSTTQVTAGAMNAMSATARQAYRVQQASSVRMPYLVMAAVLVLLAVGLAVIKLPRIVDEATQDFRPGGLDTSAADSIWRHKWLLLAAVGIFVYVGAEVSIGSFLISYFQLPEIGSLTAVQGAKLVGYYWGGAMVGRFLGSAILQRVRTGLVLGLTAVLAAVLVLTSMATHGNVAVVTILAVGLCNSVMFPSIFSLGVTNLGALTSKGSSLMVMSIVGGAILPLAYGRLADRIGLQQAFVIPVICYAYIAIFGFAARNLATAKERFEDPV